METIGQRLGSLKAIERKVVTSLGGEREVARVVSFRQRMGWYRQIVEDRPVVFGEPDHNDPAIRPLRPVNPPLCQESLSCFLCASDAKRNANLSANAKLIVGGAHHDFAAQFLEPRSYLMHKVGSHVSPCPFVIKVGPISLGRIITNQAVGISKRAEVVVERFYVREAACVIDDGLAQATSLVKCPTQARQHFTFDFNSPVLKDAVDALENVGIDYWLETSLGTYPFVRRVRYLARPQFF